MAKYRNRLPQLAGNGIFLTDGGMETTMIFHEGIDLPYFAVFNMMQSESGVAKVRDYYRRYAEMARRSSVGFVLESPTWRANLDWAAKLGYSKQDLADINRRSIELMAELRRELETPKSPMVISGAIGPRGDGYRQDNMMSCAEATDYHIEQIRIFADSEADMASAFTLNYVEEAVGIAQAAKAAGIPVAISFTLETDGKLPTGQSLKDAILQVDAETQSAPAYYMINCAHPSHFERALANNEAWLKRLRGIRANASKRSHAELDAAPELDMGNPVELGQQYRDLRRKLPHLTVLGGCCGTDHRHVEQIAFACIAA
jgi:homocysteine S-methyltransferase